MASVKAHIVLLCLAGYLVAAEARFLNLIVNDDVYSPLESNVRNTKGASIKASDIVGLLKMIPHNERERREKEEQQALNNYFGKLLKQRGRSINALRFTNYHVPASNFLQTLNNFLTRNTNNNYKGKRDACSSGFGTPESRNRCKRQKNRLFLRKWKRDMRRKYAQHMLVERARSDSDSYSDGRDSDDYASDGNDSDENKASGDDGSDENASDDKDINDYNSNEDYRMGKKKSRFQIVDNAKAKRERERKKYSTESEEVRKPTYSSDETDRFSSNENSEQKKPQQDTYYSGNELSAESSEENKASSIDKKEKFMYLQGTRLQKPYQRAHDINGRRDPSRMRHFLPKRYNWDPDMIHDIRDFWNHGLKIHFKDYLMKT